MAGCMKRGGDAPRDIDDVARAYVRLALALGERDPDSLDFSIAPAEVAAEVRKSYLPVKAIHEQAESLLQRLSAMQVGAAQRERRDFLVTQLGTVAARAEMLEGQRWDFDSEAQRLFDVTRLPDTRSEERRALRAKVHAMLPLPARPGEGDAERYARYSRGFVIPAGKLVAVMQAALAQCRARTLEHIALPAGESVELVLVRDKPWAAFSRYMGQAHSVIQLNVDMPMTVDDALELACHEGYPGHHVFNTLRDASLVQQKHWPEAEVQLTFSPQSYVSEAAAAYAPELAFTQEERARVERDVLFPVAGLDAKGAEQAVVMNALVRHLDSAEPGIAREYVDGGLEFVRAEQALASEALMASSESLLLYLNEYRSYMLAYTDGPRRVDERLGRTATPATRWTAYEQMMRTLVFRLDETAAWP
jgi:hypothetical protein